MKSIFTPNKTSAKLMVDFALKESGAGSPDEFNLESEKLSLIIYDLYIKARSYAIINKLAFVFSIVAGITILFWPSLPIITKYYGFETVFFSSTIVQTSVTGCAAFTFALYSHYKKRQMHTENLMRYVLYSNDTVEELGRKVIKEIERIDYGFIFSKNKVNEKHG